MSNIQKRTFEFDFRLLYGKDILYLIWNSIFSLFSAKYFEKGSQNNVTDVSSSKAGVGILCMQDVLFMEFQRRRLFRVWATTTLHVREPTPPPTTHPHHFFSLGM